MDLSLDAPAANFLPTRIGDGGGRSAAAGAVVATQNVPLTRQWPGPSTPVNIIFISVYSTSIDQCRVFRASLVTASLSSTGVARSLSVDPSASKQSQEGLGCTDTMSLSSPRAMLLTGSSRMAPSVP